MRSRPPVAASVDDFISSGSAATEETVVAKDAVKKAPVEVKSAAAKKAPVEKPKVVSIKADVKEYPWQATGVRDDVAKVYNLRLPEPFLLKLRYIAEQTPESMQSFCQKILIPAIDEKIREITEK
jgi:hypothetical protein